MSKKCLHFTLTLSGLMKLAEFGEESLNEVTGAGIMLNKNRTEIFSKGRVGKASISLQRFVQDSAIQI